MTTRRAIVHALLTTMLLAGCSGVPVAAARPPGRRRIKRMVAREAVDLGVPVDLALAVAHAESNFDAAAESRRGARGVMQIMPATARDEYAIDPDRLWDPRINIRLGLHFLGRLLRRYHGRIDLALSHYNGGSAVGRWPHARVIPATRSYVVRVERLRRHYRQELAFGRV
jgi:soluble lytic murein transglycosylase-like protein